MRPFGAPLIVAALGGCLIPGRCGADATTDIELNRRWARQAFSAQAVAADILTIAHEDVAGDTKVGRCAFGGSLRLGDRVYTRGIGVNSHSVLRLQLTRPARSFQATIGLDRNVDNTAASVRFRVAAGDAEVFATEVIRPGTAPSQIDVPLNGATLVDFTVDDGGDGRGWDQGDWVDARVLLEDGSELWLDDLARQVMPVAGLPFSFSYGGKHSSEFLHTWERGETSEAGGDGAERKTLTLTDPATGLQVTAVSTVYTDTPGVDWTLQFTNTGAAETPPIEQVRTLDAGFSLGFANGVALQRLNGSVCQADDWLPFDQSIAPGQRAEMSTSNGRCSSISPFYTLDWGSGGIVTAIGWSGQWTASAELRDGVLTSQAGLQATRIVLHPGETIRGPRVLQMLWAGGDVQEAHNRFRQTMLAHIVPREGGKPALPPIAHLSTSFYELNATNEDNVLSHLRSLEGLGFEVFWLDAYWTGPSGFPQSMGNYGLPLESVEPPDRFPHGLRSIGEAVNDAGLGFLMWFEPERVAPGTRIAREHPQWVLSPSGDGSGLLNLGVPEAREALTEYLDAAIKAYGLSWLRIDYNIDPLPYWQHGDREQTDRVGMTEIRYVEGLYRMWDDLLTANPGLRIDNCASGGRRIDLETCSRSTPLWRSDNTCDMVGAAAETILNAAVKNQVMSAGLNRYLPFSTVGQMGAEPYFFRSGFNGGIDFCEDIRPEDYPRELLRQAIAEGRRIRPYWLGDFYPLSAVTTNPSDWCVLQYHRPESGDGIVLGFRRHRSPYSAYECELRGIDPQARYEVTVSHGYTPEPALSLSGAELAHLELSIKERPGSVLVEYKRVGQ